MTLIYEEGSATIFGPTSKYILWISWCTKKSVFFQSLTTNSCAKSYSDMTFALVFIKPRSTIFVCICDFLPPPTAYPEPHNSSFFSVLWSRTLVTGFGSSRTTSQQTLTTFRNSLWVPYSLVMRNTVTSETSSVNSLRTWCKNPTTKRQYSLHGESL